MLEPEQKEEFERRFMPLTIVCGGMASSVLVFGAAAFVAASQGKPIEAARIVRSVFYLAAGLEIGTALLLRRRLLSDERLKTAAKGGLESLIGALMHAHIVLFALWESVGIFGCVLCFLSKSPADFLPFGAVAALGMLQSWPSKGHWEERAGRLLRGL